MRISYEAALSFFLLLIPVALPAQYLEGTHPRVYREPETIREVMFSADQLTALLSPTRGRVRTFASDEHADWIIIFPIVGSTAGSGGTYYRSETTIVNNLHRSQYVAMIYMPTTNAGCNGIRGTIKRLDSYSWYVYPDVVQNVFGSGGLGGLVLVAVGDPNGNSYDTTASLDGFSRIWTPVPGGGGTSSQSFSPTVPNTYGGTESAYGLRQDDGFRTNFGIFNYLPSSSVTRLFDIRVTGFNGQQATKTLNVPPCSLAFTSLPNFSFGSYIIVDVTPHDTDGGWYGFGSSNDNISQDNWSSLTRP